MRIKLYCRQHCSACKEIISYLELHHLAYDRIDVTHDQAAFNEMLALGGIATPFMLVNDQVVSYFDPDRFAAMLGGIKG